MSVKIDITVENKLIAEKRDINVYHHSSGSAYIISHNSSISIPFRTDGEGDYFHISVSSGPGNLSNNCLITLPSWVDFKFSGEGKVSLDHSSDSNRTLLNVPPGPPTWQLKVTRSMTTLNKSIGDHVTLSDVGPGGGD